MKKNSIKILYHFFALLSDKTNGFKPFAKYKLILGTLLVGLTATACGNANQPKKDEPDETEFVQPSCYEPTAPLPVQEDSVPTPQAEELPEPPIPPPLVFCYVYEEPPMCYQPILKPFDSIENVPDTSRIYKVVEKMPQFPGGDSELKEFLQKNILYPKIAQEQGVEGRVVVHFVVDKTGKVTDVKILRSADVFLDKEAVRVVRLMPDWIPGEQNGEKVKVEYVLPIIFRLKNTEDN